MLLPAIAAAGGKLVPAVVLTVTAVRFATTGAHELTASPVWEDVAGGVGLILFALAVYAAAAMVIEDATRSTLLPVGRRRRGASSMGGNLHEQLERLEREAGVREQL